MMPRPHRIPTSRSFGVAKWLIAIFVAATLLALLVGCDEQPRVRKGYDQCLRRQIFKECVAAVGGSRGKAVEACDDAALMQSFRPLADIKPECIY